MKKLLFLLLTLILFGCEMYTEESNPQLNLNGPWRIINIQADYSDNVTVINGDFYAISPLVVISTSTDGWLVQNDTTGVEACKFYKNGYVWEFDYNQLIIKNDKDEIVGWYYFSLKSQFYSPGDFLLTNKNSGTSVGGKWHFSCEASGSIPANDLWITVPEIEFNLGGPERSQERFVTQKITLHLTR